MRYDAPRFDSDGLANVHTTSLPDFTKKQVRDLTLKIENGERITVLAADQFLETSLETGPTPTQRVLQTVLPLAGLAVGGVELKSGMDHNPDLAASLGTLPPAVHDSLSALWNLIPFADVKPNTNQAAEHIPAAMVFGSVYAGPISLIMNMGVRRNMTERSQQAQPKLRTNIQNGEQWWDTQDTPGAIVAYVDNPFSVPEQLADEIGGRTVIMTHQPELLGATVLFPENASAERFETAFRQAGAARSEHALIIMGKPYEIFPDLEDKMSFDIGVPRAEEFINLLDIHSKQDERYAGQVLPVTIIGAEDQPLDTDWATGPETLAARTTHETLRSRMADLQAARGQSITVIDPTKVFLKALFDKADGRPLHLAGEEASVRHYAPNFFDAVNSRPDIDQDAPPIVCAFGTSDRMTASIKHPQVACEETYYIVRDPRLRQRLETNGLAEGSTAFAIADVLADELRKTIGSV